MFDEQRARLASLYRLEIRALTPVHVGSGEDRLRASAPDFVGIGDQLAVLDPANLGRGLSDAHIERLGRGVPLATILNELDDEAKLAMSCYQLPDPGGVNNIVPNIKLPDGRPYLPGTTIKGALRTALAWAIVEAGVVSLREHDLGWRRQWAGSKFEQNLFGNDPNHDLLRALQVGDTEGIPADDGLTLTRVRVYSVQTKGQPRLAPKTPEYKFSFFVETVPAQARLLAQVRRDNYLLDAEVARKLGFDRRQDYLLNLVQHCNGFARELARREREFYGEYGPSALVDFYDQLLAVFDELDTQHECLLQVAWGSGWQAKTVGLALSDPMLTHLRKKYKLGRPGAHFPKSRRLVETSDGKLLPLGWIRLVFHPEGETLDFEPVRIETKAVEDIQVGPPKQLEELEVGMELKGRVTNVVHFGAFIDVGAERDGLVHISQMSRGWVDNPRDVVQPGEQVTVWVISVDLNKRQFGLTLIPPD